MSFPHPALHASHSGIWIATAEGTRAVSRGEAIGIASETPVILLNAALTGQRLGYADLSGLDNIRLAGAFLGLDGATMRRITPGIVEFADIGQFIDAPIKTYSSGMRARLGFAIATAVDPDILLLDEVLATGDESFRTKSKQRVLELVRSAKGVVLVTHDMNWVTEFCNRAILLEKGRIIAEGDPEEVVAIHREHSERTKAERKAALDKAMQEGGASSLPPDAARASSLR